MRTNTDKLTKKELIIKLRELEERVLALRVAKAQRLIKYLDGLTARDIQYQEEADGIEPGTTIDKLIAFVEEWHECKIILLDEYETYVIADVPYDMALVNSSINEHLEELAKRIGQIELEKLLQNKIDSL